MSKTVPLKELHAILAYKNLRDGIDKYLTKPMDKK